MQRGEERIDRSAGAFGTGLGGDVSEQLEDWARLSDG